MSAGETKQGKCRYRVLSVECRVSAASSGGAPFRFVSGLEIAKAVAVGARKAMGLESTRQTFLLLRGRGSFAV